MPDYSLIKPLCKELDISISELIEGEESNHINEDQLLEMIRTKNLLYSVIMIVIL